MKLALYINLGARRISLSTIDQLRELVPPEDIFTASSPEEDLSAAHKIAEKDYEAIFMAGGDGTFVRFLNTLARVYGDLKALPPIGILRLGTGNAVARLVSAGDALSDLRSYLINPSHDYLPLSLIETDGFYYPFGGLGWDAQWLEDYERLNTLFPEVIKGRVGYITAFVFGTVPKRFWSLIKQEKVFVEITNGDKTAYFVGDNGVKGKEIPPQAEIFSGEVNSIAFGTVPDYGYGIRILPFANRYPEFMHMRIVKLSMLRALAAAPSIYKGNFRHPDVVDVYCSDCTVRLSAPLPLQIAGESMGRKTHVAFHIVPSIVNLIRFI